MMRGWRGGFSEYNFGLWMILRHLSDFYSSLLMTCFRCICCFYLLGYIRFISAFISAQMITLQTNFQQKDLIVIAIFHSSYLLGISIYISAILNEITPASQIPKTGGSKQFLTYGRLVVVVIIRVLVTCMTNRDTYTLTSKFLA